MITLLTIIAASSAQAESLDLSSCPYMTLTAGVPSPPRTWTWAATGLSTSSAYSYSLETSVAGGDATVGSSSLGATSSTGKASAKITGVLSTDDYYNLITLTAMLWKKVGGSYTQVASDTLSVNVAPPEGEETLWQATSKSGLGRADAWYAFPDINGDGGEDLLVDMGSYLYLYTASPTDGVTRLGYWNTTAFKAPVASALYPGAFGPSGVPGMFYPVGTGDVQYASVDPVTHSLSYGSAGLGTLTLSLRKAAKVVVGDFDGDTRDELLVVRTDTNTARLFGWDGTHAVAELTEANSLLADLRDYDWTVVNLDGDAKDEIAISAADGQLWGAIELVGSTFAWKGEAWTEGEAFYAAGPHTSADLDGDGDEEVIPFYGGLYRYGLSDDETAFALQGQTPWCFGTGPHGCTAGAVGDFPLDEVGPFDPIFVPLRQSSGPDLLFAARRRCDGTKMGLYAPAF